MKRFILTVIALLPVLAAGCLPNATWLPDSSSFVYTGGPQKDTLYLYDLEKKAPRTLVEEGAGPSWPAVSADGKRIAVVLRKEDETAVTLEVIVFDRDGKEQHHSAIRNWVQRPTIGSNRDSAPQAFWVPGQDKLLLCSNDKTGVYDLKTKGLVKRDGELTAFGDSPIRRDGKGYLEYYAAADEVGFVVVDWDGNEKKVEMTPKNLFENAFSDGNPLQGIPLRCPLMSWSRWDGSTAVVTWNDVRVTVDPEKGAGKLERFKPVLNEDKKVVQQQIGLSGGGVIRALELSARFKQDLTPGDPLFFGSYRIEVVKQGAKEPKTLMDNASFFRISPSPDGKKAVVKCSKTLKAIFTESKPRQDMLFLIDGVGDVADTIDLTK